MISGCCDTVIRRPSLLFFSCGNVAGDSYLLSGVCALNACVVRNSSTAKKVQPEDILLS